MVARAARFLLIPVFVLLGLGVIPMRLYHQPPPITQHYTAVSKSVRFATLCEQRLQSLLKPSISRWWLRKSFPKIPPHILTACDGLRYFPGTQLMPDVGFFFKTAEHLQGTRVKGLLDTWGRHVRSSLVALVANKSRFRGLPCSTSEVDFGPWRGRKLRKKIKLGGIMNLVAERHAFRSYPRFRWYYFHDDDTFVVLHRLLAFIRYVEAFHDPLVDDLAFGHLTASKSSDVLRSLFVDQPQNFTYQQIEYLAGGPGMLFSRAVMKRLDAHWLSCPPHDDADACIGLCLHLHNITVLNASAFRWERFKPSQWDEIPGMTDAAFTHLYSQSFAFHSLYTPAEFRLLYNRTYNFP
eukprot:TRINITY_DN4499_c0_g1_i1.p1 TRINITY_DN4499_c0_g1~~TRINITY_DN4499_c0_g1_i1.p1  ORF type:complete len:352 (+),score=5.34 TRINITY_DN4499_c0_g1_i1:66-1121(+)